ncbi:hypothetical protein GCM10010345_93220 [Streptomyces canarius]|uniref:Lycopene cyclase n=1 Tax=Streptomyces canarius TaxID=285453 RepID=A0ABQ3DE02_9ACTN|nr:hypothetical protein GCM10010345_93220 [Streptomyces canarius]
MPEANAVVVGAGAAGLSLAHRLAESVPGLRTPSVVLVDAPPGPLRPPPRTWCYWTAEPGRFDAAVRAEWQRLRVRPRTGAPVEGNIAPLRYRMIRSDDFERVVSRDLARSPTVRRLEGTVETVEDVPGGAHVRLRDAHGRTRVPSVRWVFDSRPPGSLPAARTTLLQHFHGWFVRTARPVFDPAAVELMDFRTPQPAHGLSFGYVLPTSPCEALVEYTEFSAHPLTPDGCEAAVRHYADDILRLGERQVPAGETGVIAMTDAPVPRQTGASAFRIGAAGGATRPATGYTFAGLQRQTRAVADALRRADTARCPPPPTRGARASWTPSCSAPWTAAGSTARNCSAASSPACPWHGCCGSSTETPARTRTCPSACARLPGRCCDPPWTCPACPATPSTCPRLPPPGTRRRPHEPAA